MNVFIEALSVGLLTSIIGFIISTLFMIPQKRFNFKTYTFWPWILLSYFITGFLIHLICQFSGINKWYCKNGNACK
jgi:hypothetical protein